MRERSAEMDDANRQGHGKPAARGNWTVVLNGILLIASIAAVALHLGAIAWSGTLQNCTSAVDIALIMGISVGAISLFIQAPWINGVIIGTCIISITAFGLIVGSAEFLCGGPLRSGIPWPSAILVAIYLIRSIFFVYKYKSTKLEPEQAR